MVDVLPALYQLRESLELVVIDKPAGADSSDEESDSDSDESDDSAQLRETPAVLRIAAKASMMLLDKYLNLIWECDIYVFAISSFSNFFAESSIH